MHEDCLAQFNRCDEAIEPTSHDFYIKVCGMTPVAPDPNKENLLWCEFTPEQAAKL